MRELFSFGVISFVLLTLYLFLHWVMPVGIEVYLELPVEWFVNTVEYLWNQMFYTIERHTFLFTLWVTSVIIGTVTFILMNDV